MSSTTELVLDPVALAGPVGVRHGGLTGSMGNSATSGSESGGNDGLPTGGEFVPPPKRLVVLSMTCVLLAMFLAALSQTVVATTLPLIVADLGGFDRYTWAATSYMIAATVAYPIVGQLSDIYGRKRFLILGTAVFMVGSVLVGLSASMTQVVAFRAVQGIGGGIIMTCCYISVADLFLPDDRGRFHGLIGAMYGVASVAGPILGGFVGDSLSWHWAFILIALAGIPILVLTARVYPRHGHPSGPRRPDYPGMATLVLAVVPILLALSSGGVQYSWDTPQIIGLLAFGVAMIGVFIAIEARVSWPVMPLGAYANRAVGVAVVVTLLTSLGLYGSVLFLPLFFQIVLGISATASGNLLAPMLLGMVVGGIVSGQLLSRTGGHYRIQGLVGTGLMTVGIYLLSTMDETTSLLTCGIYTVITGLGFGATVATFTVAVQNAVPFALVGTATSALQFHRSVGGMLGLAVLGAVMTRSFSSALDETVPDRVSMVLAPGRLDALKKDPVGGFDADATEPLRSLFVEAGAEGAALADMLLESMVSALAVALDDVFSIVAVLTALSFAVALLFRMPASPATVGADGNGTAASPNR